MPVIAHGLRMTHGAMDGLARRPAVITMGLAPGKAPPDSDDHGGAMVIAAMYTVELIGRRADVSAEQNPPAELLHHEV